MTDGYRLSEQAARKTAETVRRVLGSGQDVSAPRRQMLTSSHAELEGVLQEDLDQAEDIESGKTEASLKLITYEDSDNGAVISDEEITITNRNPEFSAKSGDYLRVTYVNGEFRPLSSGGGSLKLGKVDAAIAQGNSGTVSIWDLPASPWSLCPDGDGTLGAWTDQAGGTPVNTVVHDDPASPDDSKYAKCTALNNAMFLKLRDPPAGFDVVTGVTLTIRCRRTGDRSLRGVRIYQSDESTPLTADAVVTDDGTFTNYTLKPDVTGATDFATWVGARIKIDTGPSGTTGEVQVSAITIMVSFSTTPGGGTWGSVLDTCRDVKAYARILGVHQGDWVYVAKFKQGYEIVEAPVRCPAANAVWAVIIIGLPGDGTFKLSYGGQTTADLPFDESAANVQTALEGLSSIGAGNVSVSGTAYSYQVEFKGDLKEMPINAFTVDPSSLLGHGVGAAAFLILQGRAA